MARRLLNFLTILSLLLCLATAGLWVRSYRVADWVVHRTLDDSDPARVRASDRMFTASDGIAHVGAWVFVWDSAVFDFGWRQRDGWRWEAETGRGPPFPPGDTLPSRLGFGYHPFDPTPADNTWTRSITFPLWAAVMLFAAPPVGRAYRALRRRRARGRGLCLCCGYDLRASAGRCPECGTETATFG